MTTKLRRQRSQIRILLGAPNISIKSKVYESVVLTMSIRLQNIATINQRFARLSRTNPVQSQYEIGSLI